MAKQYDHETEQLEYYEIEFFNSQDLMEYGYHSQTHKTRIEKEPTEEILINCEEFAKQHGYDTFEIRKVTQTIETKRFQVKSILQKE